MKALTLHQPWASLIAVGVKTIETRSWSTKHRGPIAIHAGARPPEIGLRLGKWRTLIAENEPCIQIPGNFAHPMPLGAVVATAVLVDCVPIVGEDEDLDREDIEQPCIEVRPEGAMNAGLWHWPAEDLAAEEIAEPADVTDQRPFGDYTHGRFAWLLDDIKPTTERCPACRGDGGFQEDSMVLYGVPGGSDWADPCPTCNPEGRRTEPLGVGAYGCDPIPAKGKQGLWEWTP